MSRKTSTVSNFRRMTGRLDLTFFLESNSTMLSYKGFVQRTIFYFVYGLRYQLLSAKRLEVEKG